MIILIGPGNNGGDGYALAIQAFLNDYNIGTRLLFAGNVVKQPYMKNVNYKIASTLADKGGTIG